MQEHEDDHRCMPEEHIAQVARAVLGWFEAITVSKDRLAK